MNGRRVRKLPRSSFFATKLKTKELHWFPQNAKNNLQHFHFLRKPKIYGWSINSRKRNDRKEMRIRRVDPGGTGGATQQLMSCTLLLINNNSNHDIRVFDVGKSAQEVRKEFLLNYTEQESPPGG